jgi:hypothetical protein
MPPRLWREGIIYLELLCCGKLLLHDKEFTPPVLRVLFLGALRAVYLRFALAIAFA